MSFSLLTSTCPANYDFSGRRKNINLRGDKLTQFNSSPYDWPKLAAEIESLLRLSSSPVSYKKLDKLKELDSIPALMKLEHKATFCQVPSMVRSAGMTVGLTRDNFGARCARINGLLETKKRERQRNLDAALKSLDVLNERADRLGLYLGIENRFQLHEIPDFLELGVILKRFEGARVKYWHDAGHAQAQENMGIIPQGELLKAYGENLVGADWD